MHLCYGDDIFDEIWTRFLESLGFDRTFFEMRRRDFNFPSPPIRQSMVRSWGYRISVGPDGVPKIETYGDVPESMRKQLQGYSALAEGQEYIEPFTDVLVDDERLDVIVEVPGINKQSKKDINIEDSVLTIKFEGDKRAYFKKIDLARYVDVRTLDSKRFEDKLKNGIFHRTYFRKE